MACNFFWYELIVLNYFLFLSKANMDIHLLLSLSILSSRTASLFPCNLSLALLYSISSGTSYSHLLFSLTPFFLLANSSFYTSI